MRGPSGRAAQGEAMSDERSEQRLFDRPKYAAQPAARLQGEAMSDGRLLDRRSHES
jgi:hypothetical protein